MTAARDLQQSHSSRHVSASAPSASRHVRPSRAEGDSPVHDETDSQRRTKVTGMSQRGWNDFYLVQDELRRSTDADVDAAEAALGVLLPAGYRELMTTLGGGVISDILRVIRPAELEERQEQLQGLAREAWFFEDPDETLTPSYAFESFMIADSVDGDMIIFHPTTGHLHVLPRHLDRTYVVGTDLWDVVAWFLDSGVPCHPHPFRYFESFVGPIEAANGRAEGADLDQMASAIRSLGLHDVEEEGVQQRTFFVKAIGGYISIQGPEGPDANIHLRYRTDLAPAVRARIWNAAVTAGVTFWKPWSMTRQPK